MLKHITVSETNCCGCAACKNICPKNAIEMAADQKGFEYPTVNSKLCVECGLCVDVCPINCEQEAYNKADFQQEIYALQHSDLKTREKSTSGGAFSLFSDYVLKKGGKVYGSSLTDDMYVKHISVENHQDLEKLRGSKYVQSSIGECFRNIKAELKDGKTILFCGTPCQVDGLLHFLPEALKTNLVTVDFICHGVPSPQLWKDYVAFLEKTYNAQLIQYIFRSKIAGWHTHVEEAKFINNKTIYNTPQTKVWDQLFHKNLSLRPHCYVCEYTSYNRVSDITIADFWGIENHIPKMDDNRGTSLVLINTQKGKEIFHDVNNNATVIKVTREQCKQRALFRKAYCKYDKDLFWKEYAEEGFSYIAKKYAKVSKKRMFKVQMMILLHRLGLLNILYKLFHK